MAFEEPKQIVQQFYDELFDKHNLAVVDDLLSDDYIGHEDRGSGREEVTHGPEGVKECARMFYSAFPNQKSGIDDISVENDKVTTKWTTRGTHYGRYMGIPPTQKHVTIGGTCIDRVANGKIVESWTIWNLNDLLQQLEVPEWKVAA